MKFFTLPALLAAAVFSAVVVVPFVVGPKPQIKRAAALEVSMAATRPGFVQVYFPDNSGALSEGRSSKLPLVQSSTPRTYRLTLPAGRFGFLRFDPLSRAGAVTLHSIRVVTRSGRQVRPVAFADIKAGQQIEAIRETEGRLEITTTPAGDDAQVTISLSPPLEIGASWHEHISGFWPLSFSVFAALAVLLWSLDRFLHARVAMVAACRTLAERPGRALAVAAGVAVIASAYPIVFLGKSHVSPNFSTPLLYDAVPTLPHATHTRSESSRGADVGAMMWAHLPYSIVEHRALRRGELPWWNRYNSLGTPLLGQGQSMIGDPLHLPVVLFNGAAWAWDAKFLLAKCGFALGLGLLVLRLTNHLPAALVVALVTPFIGFFIYRINHAAYFSLCYAPWALYAWVRIAQAASWRAVAGWAAALLLANFTLLNSGTVKEAYMLLLTMNFSGACVLLSSSGSWRTRLARLAAAAWSGVLLILLSAPIWATFLHTLRNAQTNYELGAAYQIQPSLLLGAFDEAFFRLIMPGEAVFNPALNFLLLLGLLYFLVTLRSERTGRTVLALAASSLVPFSLVFGLVPPSWIIAVPLLGRVQHIDNSFLCGLIVLWSVLAGVGFARAAARLGTDKGRGDLAVVTCCLMVIIGGWIAFRQTVHRGAFGPGMTFSVLLHGQVLPVSKFVWGYLATLLAASAGLAFAMRRTLCRGAITPAAGLLITLCAGVLVWRNGLQAEAVGFETYVVRPPPRADLHAPSPAMDFVRDAQAREPGRGFGFHDNFFPGWTGVYGLESINGPDALMNPWYRELVAASGIRPGISWDFTVPPDTLAGVRPFLDALNVRYYFNRGHDEAVLGKSLEPVCILDLDIWQSPTAWPRAFFTDRIHVYDDVKDLMQTIKSGDGRAFAAVQRSASAALPGLDRTLAQRSVAAASNYLLTENTTSFDVHANGPGVIVLSETFWPGDFRAEVNGRKTPVLRLNHAFKGVAVNAPGDYRVTFRYVPRNFPRNLMLGATGVVLLVLSLVAAFRTNATLVRVP